eukprot:1992957-Rhodomonas_salina.2
MHLLRRLRYSPSASCGIKYEKARPWFRALARRWLYNARDRFYSTPPPPPPPPPPTLPRRAWEEGRKRAELERRREHARSSPLPPYAHSIRCPVLPTRTVRNVRYCPRAQYAMSGTNSAYCATRRGGVESLWLRRPRGSSGERLRFSESGWQLHEE